MHFIIVTLRSRAFVASKLSARGRPRQMAMAPEPSLPITRTSAFFSSSGARNMRACLRRPLLDRSPFCPASAAPQPANPSLTQEREGSQSSSPCICARKIVSLIEFYQNGRNAPPTIWLYLPRSAYVTTCADLPQLPSELCGNSSRCAARFNSVMPLPVEAAARRARLLLPMQDSRALIKSFVSMKGIHTLDS